jgi:hypothetical protein
MAVILGRVELAGGSFLVLAGPGAAGGRDRPEQTAAEVAGGGVTGASVEQDDGAAYGGGLGLSRKARNG